MPEFTIRRTINGLSVACTVAADDETTAGRLLDAALDDRIGCLDPTDTTPDGARSARVALPVLLHATARGNSPAERVAALAAMIDASGLIEHGWDRWIPNMTDETTPLVADLIILPPGEDAVAVAATASVVSDCR